MQLEHPKWSRNTNIYEINVRQYTKEGTLNAFKKHLPRLKDMGVETLWFMPVTPISDKDKKGSLGSYYAVQNYKAVNPEFGTFKDFIQLVKTAHELNFKVIIDWVANHTGNDNKWIEKHPDFFCYENEMIIHPNGWSDVSKLNYENASMQHAMIDAMKFWVTECDIDGFRCDMAHLVPLEFWVKAKKEINIIKRDLFWLAECEEPDYHEVFDATYTWQWMHKTESLVKRETNLYGLLDVLKHYDATFYKDAYRVYFTSNHDENSWNGTEYEKFGNAAKALAVFSCSWQGLPLIYSGQELPNNKRLLFFDKDFIEWKPICDLHNFYKTLLQLRKTNAALTADSSSSTQIIYTTCDDKIFAFLRKSNEDEVLVILNLSEEKISLRINDHQVRGNFKNIFNTKEYFNVDQLSENNFDLYPWDYRVLEKQKAL